MLFSKCLPFSLKLFGPIFSCFTQKIYGWESPNKSSQWKPWTRTSPCAARLSSVLPTPTPHNWQQRWGESPEQCTGGDGESFCVANLDAFAGRMMGRVWHWIPPYVILFKTCKLRNLINHSFKLKYFSPPLVLSVKMHCQYYTKNMDSF